MPRWNGRFINENFLIMSMTLIMGDWPLQCFHFVKRSWISVVLRIHLHRGPSRVTRFSLLVAAIEQHSKAFSGFASPGILYSFQFDFRYLGDFRCSLPTLWEIYLATWTKGNSQPWCLTCNSYIPWKRESETKQILDVIILKFCFLQPTRNTLLTGFRYVLNILYDMFD